MKRNYNLHDIQMLILRELLLKPLSRFTDLNIKGLASDHFSYHINHLVEINLVEKEKGLYVLTKKGKEFANTMDVEKVEIEKQPKVGVLIIVQKKVGDDKLLLLQKRLKEPYYGYIGFISGKVRFGETIIEAAHRELREEAGLEADLKHCYVIHELVYSEEGQLLEDKIFHVIKAANPIGKLQNFSEGENEWKNVDEFYGIKKKFYDEEELFELMESGESGFLEKKYIVDEF